MCFFSLFGFSSRIISTCCLFSHFFFLSFFIFHWPDRHFIALLRKSLLWAGVLFPWMADGAVDSWAVNQVYNLLKKVYNSKTPLFRDVAARHPNFLYKREQASLTARDIGIKNS